MLSIVTVCYNSEKSIERTIKSVLGQSTDKIEHIFIDGKSEDKTVSIIESYRKKYEAKGIKMVVVCERDNGIYDAMNKGIKLSTGSIIGLLNSDDWYEPNTASLVMETFHNNPGLDIAMGAVYIHNGINIITKSPQKRGFITSRNFNHPAMFVSKECYQAVGPYGESDFSWYLKALKMNRQVILLKNVLANFSAGGVSTRIRIRDIPRNIKSRYKVYRENGYSHFYFLECIFQEIVKYCLYKNRSKGVVQR